MKKCHCDKWSARLHNTCLLTAPQAAQERRNQLMQVADVLESKMAAMQSGGPNTSVVTFGGSPAVK